MNVKELCATHENMVKMSVDHFKLFVTFSVTTQQPPTHHHTHTVQFQTHRNIHDNTMVGNLVV